MMDNPDNNYHIILHMINNAMLPVCYLSDAFPQIGFRQSSLRMTTQQIEQFVKASKIAISYIGAELLDAVFTNYHKICPSRRA